MASVTFGGGVTNITGSHAGNTFARNKGGAYVKRKPIGTNPRSQTQLAHRTTLGNLSKHYTYVLSDAERLTWATFASVHPVINRLGNTTFLSGQQMFAKLNATSVAINGIFHNLPPASSAISSPTSIAISPVSGSPGSLVVSLSVATVGSSESALIWLSPPMNPGRGFISSQLRRLPNSYVLNTNTAVLTQYHAVFGAEPTSGGQRIFIRGQVWNSTTGITSTFIQTSGIWL